ncbi:MAG: glycosyltransferase [Eubacterium sp.]|nr:glycosyltransferase [Eubacterium sp.]
MLYITTVIYKKSINELPSKKSLTDFVDKYGVDSVRLIVVDNSPKSYLDEKNEDYSELISGYGLIYIRNNKNLGLSKAYNRAVKYAEDNSVDPKKDFMMFLDDDTTVPFEYLSKVYDASYKASSQDEPNVITGIIRTDKRNLSPMKGFRYIYRDKDYIRMPGMYKDITFINSTMTIRLDSLIRAGRFNEEQFLDMIDFTLAYKLSEKGLCSVQVIDAAIIQSFSGRNVSDRKTLLKRYGIYKKDFTTYCRISKRSRALCMLALLKRRVMIELKASRGNR